MRPHDAVQPVYKNVPLALMRCPQMKGPARPGWLRRSRGTCGPAPRPTLPFWPGTLRRTLQRFSLPGGCPAALLGPPGRHCGCPPCWVGREGMARGRPPPRGACPLHARPAACRARSVRRRPRCAVRKRQGAFSCAAAALAAALACRSQPDKIDMLNALWVLDSLVSGKPLPRGECGLLPACLLASLSLATCVLTRLHAC